MKNNYYAVVIIKGKKKNVERMWFEEDGFFFGFSKAKESHRWDELSALELDGPDNLDSRVTAGRLLTLGVFAFAAKKKTGESYAYMTLTDGSVITLEFPKKSYVELKAIFAPYMGKITSKVSDVSAPKNAAEQLKELASLLEQGLINQDDFDAAKKQVLGL